MHTRTLVAAVAALTMLAAGCSKSEQPPAKTPATTAAPAQPGGEAQAAPAPAPVAPLDLEAWIAAAPADVLGLAFLPDGLALTDVKQFVSAIEPSAASGLAALPMMAAGPAAQTFPGLTIDMTRPLRVIILDPKKHPMPLVVVGTITGKPGGDQVALEAAGAQQAAGAPAALAALGALPAQLPSPARFQVVLLPRHLVAAFGAELDAAIADIKSTAQSKPEMGMVGEVVDMYAGGARSLAENTSHVTLYLDSADGRGTLHVRLSPTEGSTLAGFVAAQSPYAFDGIQRLDLDDTNMLMDAQLVAGPARKALVDQSTTLSAQVYSVSEEKREELHQLMGHLMDLMSGRMSMAFHMAPGPKGGSPTFELQSVMGLSTSEPGQARAVMNQLFALSAGAAKKGKTVMGMKQDIHFVPKAGVHHGVPLARVDTKVKPPGKPMVKQSAYLAVHAGDWVMSAGKVTKKSIGTLLDRLAKNQHTDVPAAVQPLFELARQRKASALLTIDAQSLAKVHGSSTQSKLGVVGLSAIFVDGDMELGLDFLRAP